MACISREENAGVVLLIVSLAHREFREAAVPESSLGRTVKTKANGDGRQLVWETNGPILLSSCPAADRAGHSGEAQTVLWLKHY